MERILLEKLLKLLVVLGTLIYPTESLSCYQCNVFIRGSPWPCDSERGMKEMDNCHACLKTFTRAYQHNTFHDRLWTSYESRVCVRDREYVKSAGCHNQETDSGYMKRCFCFDDFCNSSPRLSLTFTLTSSCLIFSFIIKRYL